MQFTDLEFERAHGCARARMQFGKYQLSVIKEDLKDWYEVAIFDDDMFVQLPGIHPNYFDDWCDDVIPGLDQTQVQAIMIKLELIRGIQHNELEEVND